ncbi:MAG TPA: energy transducer TonB [Polyangia bacterium]|jgi:protein TonB|nr:energy transducer TonB [Polyangia bacterium]
MFDSVLAHNVPRRQIGKGAILSFTAHVAVIALALYISSRPHEEDKKNTRKVMLFNPPPPPPPPPAGGGAVTKPKVEHKKVIKKPDTVVQTTKKESPKPQEHEKPQEEPDPAGVEGGVKGGVAGGVVGGVVGGSLGSTIPFGVGMVRPTISNRPSPIYNQEALALRVSGTALVKCIVKVDGTLTNCRIIKGLPHMDQSILDMLHKQWRYDSGVMFQGHPVQVEMVIPVTVKAP